MLDAITPAQCRAARAMVGWTINDLAAKVGTTWAPIQAFETHRTIPHKLTMRGIISALTDAGVVFVPHGVTLPAPPNQQE